MRTSAVFVLLVALLGVGGYVVALRPRAPHPVPSAWLSPSARAAARAAVTASASAAPGQTKTAAPTAPVVSPAETTSAEPTSPDMTSADTTKQEPASSVAADAGEADADVTVASPIVRTGPLGRPLRVVTTGLAAWAPVMFADYTKHAVRVETFGDAVARLAKGGDDPDGADVAVASYPALVGGLERLRALAPEAFLLVGWSRGGEILSGPDGASLPRYAAAAATGASELDLVTSPDPTATLFALAALDVGGLTLDRSVHVVTSSPSSDALVALDRGAAGEPGGLPGRHWLLTTADAPRLVPIVAFAPRALLEAHADETLELTRAYLGGVARVRRDPAGAARAVASSTEGAASAMAVLDVLGQTEFASAADEAAAFGVGGARSPVTLDAVLPVLWRAARAAGMVSGQEPAVAPARRSVIEAWLRTGGGEADAAATTATPSTTPAAAGRASSPVLVRRRFADRVDDETIAAEAAFLAGVFERAVVRVTATGQGRARAIVAAARERFDVAPGRLVEATGEPRGAWAAIEVVAR